MTARRSPCRALRLGLASCLLAAPLAALASISFVEPQNLPLSFRGATDPVYGIARGDFDRDGKLDVAVTGTGHLDPAGPAEGIDLVAVLLGNGDGTFQAPVVVTLGPGGTVVPFGIAAADLDEDGRLDLAVVSYAKRQVLVLRGRGDGTFFDPVAFPTGTALAHLVQVADLDRDGHLDLVVSTVYEDLLDHQVAVLRGDGQGGLGAPAVYTVGRLPHGLAVADVDGKNGPDILTVGFANGTLDVLLNDGTGHFPATATSYPLRTNPTGLAVADFDGDGDADALVSGREGVYLAQGRGDGSFLAPPVGSLVRTEFWLQRVLGDGPAEDLDGDGIPDPVFTHIGALNLVTALMSKGGLHPVEWVASPGPAIPLDFAGYPEAAFIYGAVAGDFDGDGAQDLVATAGPVVGGGGYQNARPGGLSILRGVAGAPGSFQAPRLFPARTNWGYAAAGGMALGQVDGDAVPDLVMIADSLDVLPGTGGGELGPGALALGHWTNTFVNSLRLSDLDLDGKLDALWLGTGGVQGGPGPLHFVALGNGDGTFRPLGAFAPQGAGYGGRSAVVADLTGDGRPDLAVLTVWIGSTVPAVRTQIEAWRNDPPVAVGGPPAFVNTAAFDVQTSPGGVAFWTSTALAAGDLDGDGKLDLVAQRNDDGAGDDLLLFRGHGDGTFGAAEVIWSDLGAILADLLPGDLDGDGKLDLVAVGGSGAWVLRGQGDGRFAPPVAYPACVAPGEGRLLDLDGDRRLDLLLACTNGFVVLPGVGDGTFGPRQPFAFDFPAAYGLAVGDLDADGRPDVVVGHPTGQPGQNRYFTVLRNDSGPHADLDLTMSRAPASAHAAEVVTHTLTCRNRGPEAATSVTLRDPLRAGLTLVSASSSQGTCGQAGGIVSCALGDLAPGASATMTLKVRPAAPGTLWNTASVRASVPDPETANNGAGVSTAVAAALADLSATLRATPDPVDVGGSLTYTATVASAGPSLATQVRASLPLPGGLSLVSAQSSRGSCTASGATVTCALGSMDSGETASVTVVATATPQAAGTAAATATVTAAEPDPAAGDNAATARTVVAPVADLQASLSAAPDPVEVDGSLVFTMAVSNAGPSGASGVTASLPLPAGATFLGATASQGSCAAPGGTVTCSFGAIPAGGSAAASVTVKPATAGALGATATATAGEKDPAAANNAATARVTVNAAQPAGPRGGGGCGCSTGTPSGFLWAALALALRAAWRGRHETRPLR